VNLEDRKNRGGMVPLEAAIAATSGGFPILERRKIASLIEAPERTVASKSPVVLSLKEIAALDLFWKETGGFLGTLRPRSLADSLSKFEAVGDSERQVRLDSITRLGKADAAPSQR
jgi:hypothetical protein